MLPQETALPNLAIDSYFVLAGLLHCMCCVHGAILDFYNSLKGYARWGAKGYWNPAGHFNFLLHVPFCIVGLILYSLRYANWRQIDLSAGISFCCSFREIWLIPQGWLHKLGVNEFDRRPRMNRFAFSRAGMFHVKHPVPYPTKTPHNQHKRPKTYNMWAEGRFQ